MVLLSGSRLRRIMDDTMPFESDLRLKPAAARRTVLAANVNLPLEVQARGFVAAAAEGEGSPLLIQLSYNALRVFGDDPALGVTPAVRSTRQVLVDGARLAARVITALAEHYNCQLVALALDHFQVPPLDMGVRASPGPRRALALALLDDAADCMRQEAGVEPPSREERQAFAGYLCSRAYREFVSEFCAVVAAVDPAWGMIDTERLPPLLDFAVTREVVDAVRSALGNNEIMLEAEYGATGAAGQELDYRPLAGAELERMAAEVAAFVAYTGADAIAYPIGMVHAAPAGERHRPDTLRLETVQRAILARTGRYVPFAQHGGSGAAALARGLVGKTNVNTAFLVAAAAAIADYTGEHQGRIRAGDKRAAGALYQVAIDAVRRETASRLQEAGTWQTGRRYLEPALRPGGYERSRPIDPDVE